MAESGKVVFEQADVFVHTSVPASTAHDNIIRGRVQVIEKHDCAYVDWRPVDLSPSVDFEVKYYSTGNHEYGVVDAKLPGKGGASNVPDDDISDSYAIHFPATAIQSVRRSDTRLAWSYIVFILRDGTTQPGLHFHNGGITELMKKLQRYVWLIKSATNSKVYIAESPSTPLPAGLEHMQALDEVSPDNLSKFFNSAYYGTMLGFAKVSKYVLDNVGTHGSLLERRPRSCSPQVGSPKSGSPLSTTPRSSSPMLVPRPHRASGGSEQDFEFVEDKRPVLAKAVHVELELPLQPEEWCSFMDSTGALQNVKQIKERIMKGGVHSDIRCEVWKFLLGMYSFDSTYEERESIREQKCKEYETMKVQWETMSDIQEKRFADFSHRKQLAYKDAIRTDRDTAFYHGNENENVQRLYRILMTYCMYNFDLGYVQGMSDLLSPILFLMENEVDAFWCFAGLMEKEERNFEVVQQHMKTQLECLFELLKFLYPKFAAYLQAKECGNLYFCFKWLLINFKREFSVQDIMTIWEVSWVQNYTPYFKLFLCVAILEENMEYMMENNYGFNEILKHINSISMKLELGYVLKRALSLILQLRATENLPENIRKLLVDPQTLLLVDPQPFVRSSDPKCKISTVTKESNCKEPERENLTQSGFNSKVTVPFSNVAQLPVTNSVVINADDDYMASFDADAAAFAPSNYEDEYRHNKDAVSDDDVYYEGETMELCDDSNLVFSHGTAKSK